MKTSTACPEYREQPNKYKELELHGSEQTAEGYLTPLRSNWHPDYDCYSSSHANRLLLVQLPGPDWNVVSI